MALKRYYAEERPEINIFREKYEFLSNSEFYGNEAKITKGCQLNVKNNFPVRTRKIVVR